MTTSATAEGKLRVSHQKGELVPEGLIMDGLGRPSTNPADYYNKPYGSILPLGGAALGHKGFGLSVMIDVLCGILSGSGVVREDLPRGANGVWLHLLSIEQFLPQADYDRWMQTYVRHIKDCPRAEGCQEILLPGEIETRRQQQRGRRMASRSLRRRGGRSPSWRGSWGSTSLCTKSRSGVAAAVNRQRQRQRRSACSHSIAVGTKFCQQTYRRSTGGPAADCGGAWPVGESGASALLCGVRPPLRTLQSRQ